MQVIFLNQLPERSAAAFVVMIARYRDKWVLCVHRQRDTYEFPGGHVEAGETLEQAARRELYEETGATRAQFNFAGYYGCRRGEEPVSYGALYYTQIDDLGPLPPSEIDRVELREDLPPLPRWTYANIQPHLLARISALGCLA